MAPPGVLPFLLLAALAFLQLASGYETGADPSVCTSMVPGHGVPPQSSETNPYQIVLGKTAITNSESVDITLNSQSGQDIFKGFLIQVRKPGGYTGLGLFSEVDNNPLTKNMNCFGENTAVTHNSPEEKSSITVKWSPPKEEKKDQEYQVYYTAVGSVGNLFWAGIQHPQTIQVTIPKEEGDEDEEEDEDADTKK